MGEFFHKHLGLSDDDRARIGKEIDGGRAAVGVLAEADEAAAFTAKLQELGGKPETHEVTEEGAEQVAAAAAAPTPSAAKPSTAAKSQGAGVSAAGTQAITATTSNSKGEWEMPSKTFKGVINLDVRDSIPDWGPYEQPKAPAGTPNVLFLVWDDTGFGAWDFFGGPIADAEHEQACRNGLRYTQFHTTAICSPTRSALLTGRNHTTVGMACIAEATEGFPGMNGHIPFETALIGEVLGEKGYNTYMLGKWHCVAEDETNMASWKRNWPTGRGFERYYGFLGGETDQYYPDLCQDQQFVEQPDEPVTIEGWKEGKEGYQLTADLVDHAIGMIADAKQVAPDRPFFMYFCPAPTTPRIIPPKRGRTSTRASLTWATRRFARRSWRIKRRWALYRNRPTSRRSTRLRASRA